MSANAGTAKPVYEVQRLTWVLLLGLVAVVAYAFRGGIESMVTTWTGREEYSHGFLIPLIAIFLVWQRKEVLERMDFKGSWTGVAVVAFGIALHALGQLATVFVIQQYALLIVLYGLVLAFT